MIGRTISHYRITVELGSGGMGVVYQAEDMRLKRQVALKFLPAELTRDPDAKARFIQEARAASALDHPNVCTIHDIGETDDGRLFIAMACYEGETLKERIAGGPLPLSEALDIARQIAEGLMKAHQQGIVHRDIKPANIFVTRDGLVKILDFGVAKLRGQAQLTRVGTTLGTAAYMSPEQARGEEVDRRTDIWSLGVVLYEMIAGRPPFRGEHEQAVIYAVLNTEPEPMAGLRTGVPLELERITGKCLARDPSERYQNAGDLLTDIRMRIRPSDDQSSSAPAPGAVPRKALRRWPRVIGSLAVIILVAAYAWQRFTAVPGVSAPEILRVAVLPFENLGDPEDEYFADGITDAITARLAVIHGLGVISRQSTIQYKGSNKSIAEIGTELKADYILEGTIQRERASDPSSRIRVIPQLISVSDDIHLWAETYDEEMNEVFRVQSSIAERVANALDVTLLDTEREAIGAVPTDNLEAYEYYLRGNEYFMRRYESEMATSAVRMFKRATEIDPGFTLAWASLSQAYIWKYYANSVSEPEWKTAAQTALERARELDPDSPDVQKALGYFYYYGAHDFDRALEHLEKARNGRPNDVETLSVIAFVKRRQGKWEETASLLEKAVDLNPRYFVSIGELGITYTTMRQYDKAERLLDRAIFFAPRDPTARNFKIWLPLLIDGDVARAREALLDVSGMIRPADLGFTLHGWSTIRILAASYTELLNRTPVEGYGVTDTTLFHFGLAEMYHQQGLQEQARDCWQKEQARLESAESPIFGSDLSLCLGLACAGLDRKEEAIRLAREFLADELLAEDAFLGTFRVQIAALIFVRTGLHEDAIDQLEHLLAVPSIVSPSLLRIDPAWDPLRDNPRFQKLVERGP